MKPPAAHLGAVAGRGLVEARYRGSPLSVGASGTMYAMCESRDSSHSLGPRSLAVHFSGNASDVRPLLHIQQVTDERKVRNNTVAPTNDPTTTESSRATSHKARINTLVSTKEATTTTSTRAATSDTSGSATKPPTTPGLSTGKDPGNQFSPGAGVRMKSGRSLTGV